MVVASLTPDPSGEALRRLALAAETVGSCYVFFDAPAIPGVWGARRVRTASVYTVRAAEMLTAVLGARVARRKLFRLGTRRPDEAEELLAAAVGGSRGWAEALRPGLMTIDAVEKALWLDPGRGQARVDPRIVTTGDRFLPWPTGRWEEKGRQYLVYDVAGPAMGSRTANEPPLGYGATCSSGT